MGYLECSEGIEKGCSFCEIEVCIDVCLDVVDDTVDTGDIFLSQIFLVAVICLGFSHAMSLLGGLTLKFSTKSL